MTDAAAATKFFRVAVEGATCDGREISRQDIVEMAATYVPATYTARVNMEHITGYSADAPFCAYGDVVALKTEEFEMELGGKKVKKLALLAQINPTDELKKVNARRQKTFSSIELNPNFAGTGKAYLQGLAVTDTPASLGTEVLAFAAGQGDGNFLTPRKKEKGNLFSAALETSIEFEQPETGGVVAAAFADLKSFLTDKFGTKKDDTPPPPPPAANDNLGAAIAEGFAKMTGAMEKVATDLRGEVAALETKFAGLKTVVENTDGDAGSRRKLATGGTKFSAELDW